MVWGSLYEPNTKDFDGNPMVIKKGPDAGKPTQRYEFGLAIPKTQAHFANEPGWGQLIWQAAHAAFPGNAGLTQPIDSGAFSWKITDGDSTKVSAKSKSKIPPCDKEGFKGCWVLTLSSSYAPKIYDARDVNNPVLLEGNDAIVPGYAIQVIGSVAGNSGATPGVYLNHAAVGLRGYMPEIRTAGIDVKGKFGGAVLPGATTVPAAGFVAPAAPAPVGGVPSASVAAPAPAAPPAAPAPTYVTPAPAIMGVPPVAAAPPPPPASPVGRPPHKGLAYQAYRDAGWTDEQLRADGYTG
jgi:hypothetical protein